MPLCENAFVIRTLYTAAGESFMKKIQIKTAHATKPEGLQFVCQTVSKTGYITGTEFCYSMSRKMQISNKNPHPNEPKRNVPTKPDPNPDPSRKMPEHPDPTRIPDPGKTDPTRIPVPDPGKPQKQ